MSLGESGAQWLESGRRFGEFRRSGLGGPGGALHESGDQGFESGESSGDWSPEVALGESGDQGSESGVRRSGLES